MASLEILLPLMLMLSQMATSSIHLHACSWLRDWGYQSIYIVSRLWSLFRWNLEIKHIAYHLSLINII
jgi:hypothetical protein